MIDPTDTVQLTRSQLDTDGPWTVTPAPQRKTALQALQSQLYAETSDHQHEYQPRATVE